MYTANNTIFSPNTLVKKSSANGQFPQIYRKSKIYRNSPFKEAFLTKTNEVEKLILRGIIMDGEKDNRIIKCSLFVRIT